MPLDDNLDHLHIEWKVSVIISEEIVLIFTLKYGLMREPGME